MFRSTSNGTYLFSDILVVEYMEAGSWHGHFRELEANIFRRKSPCLEQIHTWIFLGCDWSIKIQARNLRSFEFQNEASDVILGNPMAIHLNLTAGPVVVSQRSSCGWTSLPYWAARSVPFVSLTSPSQYTVCNRIRQGKARDGKRGGQVCSLQARPSARHFHAPPPFRL